MNWMRRSSQTRSQVKLCGHLIALLLAVGVLAVAGARMLISINQAKSSSSSTSGTSTAPRRSMSGQVALSMGAKSLFFITYQLMAERGIFFRERIRVNMILNTIEAIAWPVVVGFTVQGIAKRCVGTTCTMSWILIPLSLCLSLVSLLAAYISICEWRYFKNTGFKSAEEEETEMVAGRKFESKSNSRGISNEVV